MQWAVITLLSILGTLLVVLIVAMTKYFQLSRIQIAVEKAWYDDGICTGKDDALECKLHVKDDLAPPPQSILKNEFDPKLALRMVDYVARIEMDEITLPPKHIEVDRYNPRYGPTFGIAWKNGTTLVIAFRATVTHREIQDDLNAWQVSWETGERISIPHPTKSSDLNINGETPNVHSGFYGVFSMFISQVLETIGAHKPSVLLVAGHSLGGGVATLMTMKIAELMGVDTRLSSISQLGCYVYGTPRVGNGKFDQRLRSNKKINTFWRVVNDADDIQKLPIRVMPNFKYPDESPFYYEHSGPAYTYYDQWGTRRVNHFLPNYMNHLNLL